MEKILPVWQPVGWSTHEIARNVAQKFGTKTSHTGTLDPMASGIVIVLLGDERLKKYEYAKWLKTYEFEMVCGIQTDTQDGMGKVISLVEAGSDPDRDLIPIVLKGLLGEYTQTVPKYSTIKVSGKHLHEHARAGSNVELPTRSGTIHKIELIGISHIDMPHLAKDIISKIKLVEGDFRQEELIAQWERLWHQHPAVQLSKIKLRVEMTKGLYVRTLAEDICTKLGTVGFAHNIIRTKNGDYTKKEAKPVEDVINS